MTPFKQSSIKRKLTSIIMLTSCIALLLACAAFVIHELSSFRSNLVSHMSTLDEIVANNCDATLNLDRREDAEKTLATVKGKGKILATCIYKGGRVWASFH